MEADGFAGTGVRPPPDSNQLRQDLQHYDPKLGGIGNYLVRAHHDAGMIAAEIIALISSLRPPSHHHDPVALQALRHLAESQLRGELLAEEYRREAKLRAEACQHLLSSSSWRVTRPLRWFGTKFSMIARSARMLNLATRKLRRYLNVLRDTPGAATARSKDAEEV
jgi:hypothetical protein